MLSSNKAHLPFTVDNVVKPGVAATTTTTTTTKHHHQQHASSQIVTAWNGLAISAFAQASRALATESPAPAPCFPSAGRPAGEYLTAAARIAHFVRAQLWDSARGRLRRAYCSAPSSVEGMRFRAQELYEWQRVITHM